MSIALPRTESWSEIEKYAESLQLRREEELLLRGSRDIEDNPSGMIADRRLHILLLPVRWLPIIGSLNDNVECSFGYVTKGGWETGPNLDSSAQVS